MKDALLDRLDEWRWEADRQLDILALRLQFTTNEEVGKWFAVGAWAAATAVAANGLVFGPTTANTAAFLALAATGLIGYAFGGWAFDWAAYAASIGMALGLAWAEPAHQTYWWGAAVVYAVVGVAYLAWLKVRRRTR